MIDRNRPGTPATCPDDYALLAVATEGDFPPGVSAHVDACPQCQERLLRIRSEAGDSPRMATDQAAFSIPTHTGKSSEATEAIPSEASPLDDATDKTPSMIGRYRVVARLGGGGQAVVFRVVHPTLDSDFVLKWSRRPVSDSMSDRDALVREGKLLAEIDHPNIARVIDLDVHDERAFLVMEYVRGRTLRQHLAERQYTPVEAAALVAQVARAVAPAHALGICHLDLKPENIVIDQDGQPRVIDFGLALLRGAWEEEPGESGVISGTLAYLPPEQALGKKDRLGPKSDIFSLGAILYELLTARTLYSGGDTLALLRKAQECDFDRDALRRVGAPRSITRICRKALQSEPVDRHANVEALAGELERFSTRRRALVAAMGVLGLVVLGATAWLLIPASDNEREIGLQNLLRVNRPHASAGEPEEMAAFLPLRGGDLLSVRCELPREMNAILIWYNPQGELTIEPVRIGSQRDVPTIQQPASGEEYELDDRQGTDLVLVCATDDDLPSPKALKSGLEDLFNSVFGGHAMGSWDGPTALVFNRRKLERRTDPNATPRDIRRVQSELGHAEEQLKAIRKGLEKQFDFVAGVAFPHMSR